jgi:hypothetical protein
MIRNLGGLEFRLAGELEFVRDSSGQIIEYMPKVASGVLRNRNGLGPFCRFVLIGATSHQGVYAVYVNRELKYVGECTNLAFRFGPQGYGEITSRNCYRDGQSTNCKVNGLLLDTAKAQAHVQVWFCQTANRKVVEARLIKELCPSWNGRRGVTPIASHVDSSDALRPRQATRSSAFEVALLAKFTAAEKNGESFVRVSSGELHRDVGGYPGPNHRMPACCFAMRAAMKVGDRLISEPPKGTGATLTIEYAIPRDASSTK